MFHPSYPSPSHAPRVEVNGPLIKLFLPDRWNPIHIIENPDTGPPHGHKFGLKANILYNGYVETQWIPTPSGGYTIKRDIHRLPGTTHQILPDTIHLITGFLGNGKFSVSEAEPVDEEHEWFFYEPRPDGSIGRSKQWNGLFEPWHPAGPVIEEQG